MAQWLGQYTGNSHATKVLDLEETLAHAVIVFREAASPEKIQTKAKAVRKLAEKLLNARLKLLRANINDAIPVTYKNANIQHIRLENLRQHEMKVRLEGKNGILVEFGVSDLIE